MRCVAFDLDTVKLLMNIFVRDPRKFYAMPYPTLSLFASRILTGVAQSVSTR